MTTEQPEALWLADELEAEFAQGRISNHTGRKAATELRRQHARIAELEAQLESIGAGGVSGPLMGCASIAASAGSEPVAWRIDWPDEPELGHYFSEAPTDSGRCQPLYTHPSPPGGMAGWKLVPVELGCCCASQGQSSAVSAFTIPAMPAALPWTQPASKEQTMIEPTDKQLEDFAVEEQFLLFCDVDEFTQIARAVLAKWGPQPLRYDQSPTLFTVFAKCDEYEGEVPLAQYSATSEYGVLDRVMGDARNAGYTGHAKDRMTELGWRIVPVYAKPQPVAREPLTDAQIEALPLWKRFVGLWPETRREIVRTIEHHHGIKGGQHG